MLARWKQENRTLIPISVNVSRADLYHSDFMDRILGLMDKYDIESSLLHMEITETVYTENQNQILDMVNQKQAEAGRNYNKYTAWGDPEIVAEKNAIMSLVRHANIHTICTIRAKEKMEIVPGEDGKNVVQSLGEQQIMMPDFKYEPDLVLHMLAPGEYCEDGKTAKAPKVRVVKSRYRIMRRDEEYDVTPELLHQLRQYLEEGTSPEELLEMQRKDYIEGVKTYLDEHPNARVIWQVLKNDAGLQDVKLNDMQLKDLKLLFNQVAAE